MILCSSSDRECPLTPTHKWCLCTTQYMRAHRTPHWDWDVVYFYEAKTTLFHVVRWRMVSVCIKLVVQGSHVWAPSPQTWHSVEQVRKKLWRKCLDVLQGWVAHNLRTEVGRGSREELVTSTPPTGLLTVVTSSILPFPALPRKSQTPTRLMNVKYTRNTPEPSVVIFH